MGGKRSALEYKRVKIYGQVLFGYMLICTVQFSHADTNPTDVTAINSLHAALGYPVLPGWVPNGGDPCGQAWQGLHCNGSVIQSIVLNGANLGGELGDSLGTFVSIRVIDLSNNHIGGSIPSSLPVTMENLFLSDNQFTGSIPASLSTLTELTDMSLNDNLLTGEIPDAFQSLTQLINLDLSSNNLSGELPPSLEDLSTLTTLRLQNNQLSGTLDVLQDLPLKDLNVENNQFAGPIPQKLLSIPNFRKDGNPFNVNATIAPAPPSHSPVTATPGTLVSGAPSSGRVPTKQVEGPTATKQSNSGKSKKTTKRVVWISIAGMLVCFILALGLALFIPKCGRRERVDRISKQHQSGAYGGDKERDYGALAQPPAQTEKVPKGAVLRAKDHQAETRKEGAILKPQDEQEKDVLRMRKIPKLGDHKIDMSALDIYSMPSPPPPPPPPPPQPPAKRAIVEPITFYKGTTVNPSIKSLVPPSFVKSFTIGSLQQYTHSFSEENLIGGGMLGSVYRAVLPDGKLLAVKKLDKKASDHQKNEEFLELVNSIDRIRHANVVELIGYCAEHGQRLLIYEYCSNGSLHDALHSDDEFKTRLSWNARIQIALGAARALEYLHEICQPPVVHRNFKSANVLLDDDLSVRVSDCGLAALIASGSVSQLSGHLLTGYGAPEFESGIYTYQSDVYSFGVVMLELLTGRQSYDRMRTRGEQFLVRWAISQLHDIDALSRMVDPSLKGDYPVKSLSNFADIISQCVQSVPEFRPPMSEVVQSLLNMIRRESHRSESTEE